MFVGVKVTNNSKAQCFGVTFYKKMLFLYRFCEFCYYSLLLYGPLMS